LGPLYHKGIEKVRINLARRGGRNQVDDRRKDKERDNKVRSRPGQIKKSNQYPSEEIVGDQGGKPRKTYHALPEPTETTTNTQSSTSRKMKDGPRNRWEVTSLRKRCPDSGLGETAQQQKLEKNGRWLKSAICRSRSPENNPKSKFVQEYQQDCKVCIPCEGKRDERKKRKGPTVLARILV